MTSSVDSSLPPLQSRFPNRSLSEDKLKALIAKLKLQSHIEGGYFVETDRDPVRVQYPLVKGGPDETYNASTTIYYFLAPDSPLGAFHRNRGRTVHTVHRGRGRYVIIHTNEAASPSCPGGYGADELPESDRWLSKARIETFVVGQDVLAGERPQFIVEGGKYKCSFLLPDSEDGDSSEGLLISETVVPGFEFSTHDFMKRERMEALLTEQQVKEIDWMLRKA